ncbi:MAG: aminotransferase class III-fold pyridoxal phosphate-dependent enzyme [Rhodospirillales bacterium]|nr:aminotransferase class III-fold pyridoxal phosphate-dependent enzyme [Rhodospirillales bacterium]
MPDSTLTNSKIVAAYREKTRGSAKLAGEAAPVFPSGITHDARRLLPYLIYVNKARGSRKWDVDGNEYVDYIGGHGALILGHGHPTVTEAIHRQLDRGTHYGANHEIEIRWGELVKKLVPSAEKVRFVGTGTEATMLAFRLARAFTGKPKIVRLRRHFHGWHDHVSFGVRSHTDGTPTPGVLDRVAENIILADVNDVDGARRLFESQDDIAAVILEPTGVWAGFVPAKKSFVEELVRLARAKKALVIFDEVVTGFRVSPGGAQAVYGIKPDLTTLAKILAGGLPGGAVCGRKDVMDQLDFDEMAAKKKEKVGHQGTFNANPLSAAAGVAALEIIGSTDVCDRANAQTAKIRKSLNTLFHEESVPWACYGSFSSFFVFTNPSRIALDPLAFDAESIAGEKLWAGAADPVMGKLALALLVNGADLSTRPGGLTSSVHSDDDVARTAEAMRAAIHMLKAEGDL